jgi:hypothetical protein
MSRFNNPTDAVKVFGMTNHLAETELSAVEAELGLDLGRGLQRGNDRDDTYYPQFEQQVRREAAEMARHYEIFYCLEKSIRKLVSETIESSPPGANWWSSGCVPEPIAKGVADRMQREKDTGVTPRSQDPLDYTTFGELAEIIKSNWGVFGGIFSSVKAVERVMANLNTLRGPIAHCSLLAEDEVLRLQLGLRDWFRLME